MSPAADAERDADLIRLLQGGPIIALVLSEEELAAGRRLVERGAVRHVYRGAAALFGVYHLELAR